MERYMNRYKFDLTGTIVDILDKYSLVEDVYYQSYPEMECIKINTKKIDSNNPSYYKSVYICCFNDSSHISYMVELFQGLSNSVIYGIRNDIDELGYPNEYFKYTFIERSLYVEVLFAPINNIHEMYSCLEDTQEMRKIAFDWIKDSVSKRNSEEEKLRRYM